ncbi:MAG: DUF433 domain-containing protein [Gemmataceae bacterium]
MTTSTEAVGGVNRTPGVCGGDACIRRTRIMVWLLVAMQKDGKDDAGLLADYPTLTPADLDAAWAYYRRHPIEIEQSLWENTVAANHAPGQPVPPWALVQARLLGMDDERIREAFDPPLSAADLDAAWESYRRAPRPIDREIARHRLAG